MNQMKRITQITLILLIAIIQSCSPPFKQELKSKQPALGLTEQIDSIVSHKMNQYNIPGLSIGLVKNDAILYSKGYGVRSIVTHDQVTENTIFHTASISKLLTALAIMQLVEQKVITLNDKLIDLLPGLSYSDKRLEQITIKNLLNHTSGLPDIRNYHWDNNNQSDNTLTDYINGLTLNIESEPGSEYHYSNLGYNILGHIIEKMTSTTFDDYLKENILDKSGMNTSDFRYFKIADSLKTTPHSRSWITKNIHVRKNYPYTREHAASSTLNSSAKDLSKWMIHFLKTLKSGEAEGL